MPDDMIVETEIAVRKSINWKYMVLAISTLAAFLLMIKMVSEPVEPIIVMDEPVSALQLATAPTNSEDVETQSPPSLADSTSNHLLLPNESLETLPSVASLPAEELAIKSAVNTDIAAVDKSSQELTDIELAKKKAKQKAKKKTEKALRLNPTETKPQVESQTQQSIVVQQKDKEQQKEPAVAAEAKKDSAKELTKEAVKTPAQEISGWSKFTENLKQGGETPCSPAQIAMNHCR